MMNNIKLFLLSLLYIPSLFASSAPAAAAAGAGAGARPALTTTQTIAQAQAENQQLEFVTDGYPISVSFLPDGRLRFATIKDLLSGRLNAELFETDQDMASVQDLGMVSLHVGPEGERGVRKYELSSIVSTPNGKWIAVASLQPSSVSVFTVDSDTKKLKEIQGSPFTTKQKEKRGSDYYYWSGQESVSSLACSADSKWLAAVDHSGSVTIFAIDKDTGSLTRTYYGTNELGRANAMSYAPNGTWFVTAQEDRADSHINAFTVDPNIGAIEHFYHPSGLPTAANVKRYSIHSVAFSPDGKWFAAKGKDILIFAVDNENKRLNEVSKVPLDKVSPYGSLAYSHDGQVLAVAEKMKQKISLYRVNQATGALIPFTKKMLEAVRFKKAKDVLIENNLITQPGILSIIEASLMGAKATKEKQETEKDDEVLKVFQEEIALTHAQRAARGNDATQLFAAIKNGDMNKINNHLTPFTINARDEQNRTPLIAAAFADKRDAFLLILRYKGKQREDEYAQAIIEEPELKAQDRVGNTAVSYLTVYKHNDLINALADETKKRETKAIIIRKLDQILKDAQDVNAVSKLNNSPDMLFLQASPYMEQIEKDLIDILGYGWTYMVNNFIQTLSNDHVGKNRDDAMKKFKTLIAMLKEAIMLLA